MGRRGDVFCAKNKGEWLQDGSWLRASAGGHGSLVGDPPIGTPGNVPHGGNSTPLGAPVDEPVKSERSSEQASLAEWKYSFFAY